MKKSGSANMIWWGDGIFCCAVAAPPQVLKKSFVVGLGTLNDMMTVACWRTNTPESFRGRGLFREYGVIWRQVLFLASASRLAMRLAVDR